MHRGDPDLRSPHADRAPRVVARSRRRHHSRLGTAVRTFFYGCTTTAVAPGEISGPQVCRGSSLIEVQGTDLFPAPLLWILMWSLAPLLAVIGVWLSVRPRVWLIVLALLMELTGIISLGGGILFALVIEPLLLITLVATLRANRQMG